MLDGFIQYISSTKRYSQLTVRNYRHDAESFLRFCGYEDPYTPFTAELFDGSPQARETLKLKLQEWMMQRMDKAKIGAASMNRELSTLKSFFRYLQSTGELSYNAGARISMLRTPHRLPTFIPQPKMDNVIFCFFVAIHLIAMDKRTCSLLEKKSENLFFFCNF